MIDWTSDSTTGTLTLQGTVCIDQAEDVLGQLRKVALDSASEVELSLVGVEAVDVSFYQALLALRRTLDQQKRRLRILALPENHPILTTAQLLGLSSCLLDQEGRS